MFADILKTEAAGTAISGGQSGHTNGPFMKILAFTAALLLRDNALAAQPVSPTPLPADHPLIGVWRIDLPEVDCYEQYSLNANGTKRSVSRGEITESVFRLSIKPNRNGFYTWTDQIVKSNGKRDCLGEVTPVGDTATNYILLHPDGNQFLLCTEQDLNTCIGPYVRQETI